MSSESRTTSTASLIPKDKQASVPPKDYATAFANLQSTYGAGGHAPTPTSGSPPKKDDAKKSGKGDTSKLTESVEGATETKKDGEDNPRATSAPTTKDYEATFAALQSEYGFGGSAPVIPRR